VRSRSAANGSVPDRLLVYRADQWPSPQAWDAARREWTATRCRSLDALNALYGPDVVLPPDDDPRMPS